MEDITGNRYGKLTVIEYAGKNKRGRDTWKCHCDCGTQRDYESWKLINTIRSCGCGHHDDLTNKKTGKLTAISFSHFKKGDGSYWNCKCDCGNDCLVRTNSLISNRIISCGCAQKVCGIKNPHYKGYKNISATFYSNIKARVKRTLGRKNPLSFSVSIKYLWDLFTEQKGKCALTGLDIQFPLRSNSPGTASLDRIDSSKGYVNGNVQWVHKDINFMKYQYSQDYFIDMCRKVVAHRDNTVLILDRASPSIPLPLERTSPA